MTTSNLPTPLVLWERAVKKETYYNALRGPMYRNLLWKLTSQVMNISCLLHLVPLWEHMTEWLKALHPLDL